MATYKVTRPGITFAGQVYDAGDTFELSSEEKGSTPQRENLYNRVRDGKYDGIELVKEQEAPKQEETKKAEVEPKNETTSRSQPTKTPEKSTKEDEAKKDSN